MSDQLDARFSRAAFDAVEDTADLSLALAEILTARFVRRPTIEHAYELIEVLKRLGHPLCSFDESDDFVTWCDDYTKKHDRFFIVRFSFPDADSLDPDAASPSVTISYFSQTRVEMET